MNGEIILQVGVKALLRNPEGKYLLMHRAQREAHVPPKWDIIGGRIDAGTTLYENLQREVMEEAGLVLTSPVRLLAAQDIRTIPERHVVRLTYFGEIEGEPRLSEEHTDWRWFTMEEIEALKLDELDKFFKELLDQGLFKNL